MFVSVNGRIVRSRQMQDALIDAYSDYMPPGRYPIAVLDIAVDTQLVDVNVHPNKWEVRIAKQPQLIELIGQSVRKAFDLQLRTVEITPAAMETVAPGRTDLRSRPGNWRNKASSSHMNNQKKKRKSLYIKAQAV